jgi:glycerol-3-phosphate acyltransferase PlsY
MIIALLVAAALLGYLMGSIPFAFIIGRLMGNIDITKHGSGNVGGTNVLRTLGIKAGAFVMALDLAKSVVAVLLAGIIMGDNSIVVHDISLNWQAAQVLAALGAMVGHSWSVFLNFRGGKGMAAYIGGWFAMNWVIAIVGGVILILTALRTRFMSMGTIIGCLSIICILIVLIIAFNYSPIYLVYSVIATMLVVYQHRRNIDRLQTGTELRFDSQNKKQGK